MRWGAMVENQERSPVPNQCQTFLQPLSQYQFYPCLNFSFSFLWAAHMASEILVCWT